MEKEIKIVVELLRQQKIIIYPTDTIWGIGCDATNADTVDKIFKIKQRPHEKSLILLLDHESKLNKYVNEVPAVAWDLVEFADKPLTIIYPGAKNLPTNVINEDGSIAIRITRDEFCKNVIHRFGKPIVSTSANISGESTPTNFLSISPNIVNAVDYTVNWRQGETKNLPSSTIIKLEQNGEIKIIRK